MSLYKPFNVNKKYSLTSAFQMVKSFFIREGFAAIRRDRISSTNGAGYVFGGSKFCFYANLRV